MDWGDASKEVDDFLNETDDEEGARGDETDVDSVNGDEESDAGGGRPKKRVRVQTDYESGKEDGGAAAVGWSPLQKRVKTSRARKSGLKVSFPASGDGIEEGESTTTGSSQERDVAVATGTGTASAPASYFPRVVDGGYEGSQASSSLDSDDDAFFASMAAEVEKGWS